MTAILLSNPPRRNRKGQFVRGGSRRRSTSRRSSSRRSSSRALAKRRPHKVQAYRRKPTVRAHRRNPPPGASMALRDLLPRAAVGVGGWWLTDWGARTVVRAMPAEMTERIPAAAAPLVKGATALGMGWVVSSWAPRDMRHFGAPLAIGGLISAGMDVLGMLRRAVGMSGYWGARPPMSGYEQPQLGWSGEGDTRTAGGRLYDAATGEYHMAGPRVTVDY